MEGSDELSVAERVVSNEWGKTAKWEREADSSSRGKERRGGWISVEEEEEEVSAPSV